MNSPRWALVTGASSGLGVEYVRSLARSGHGIVLVARDGDRLQSVAGQVADEFGVSTEVLVADLHKPSEVATVGQRLGDTRRPVRVLIN
ncbi:MAG: SDR family NAD(P)-dependent oxidoreductase, partial [Pontimonas sp.]